MRTFPRARRAGAGYPLALGLLASLGFLPARRLEAATGLSTRMGDIRVEGVVPGRAYRLSEHQGRPYEVFNRGDGEVTVRFDVLVPPPGALLEGYEPVSNPSWVRLEPSTGTAAPGGSVRGDVVISLPDDLSLGGRRFQAGLWPRTVGGVVGAGVLSRLRIETPPGPVRIEAPGVAGPAGQGVRGILRILNEGGEKVKLELVPGASPAPGGWRGGAPESFRLSRSRVKLGPGSSEEVSFEVGPLSPGRHAFLVVAKEGGRPVSGAWVRVQVEENKEGGDEGTR